MKIVLVFLIATLLGWSAAPDETRFGPHGTFQLEYSKDSFGLRSHGVVERLANGGTKVYRLPQSIVETYIKLRPVDVKVNPIAATGGRFEREEVIGPHQIDGDKLWFGNNFYDGEGERGVGAFGCFDTTTRQYQLFSPPEVAPYEISALFVEADVAWLALEHFGEDISTFPEGLVRWNKATHQVRRYPIEFVVSGIARNGTSLRLTTSEGYAL